MQNSKIVSIQVKVDKKIADQLKRKAKQKEMYFSSYIRRVLVNEASKEKKK